MLQPWDGAQRVEMTLHCAEVDSVRFVGPKWLVGGTVFEMWLGVCEPTEALGLCIVTRWGRGTQGSSKSPLLC